MPMREFKESDRPERTREEIIDTEHSLECEMYGREYPDTFKKKYPKITKGNSREMEIAYCDHSVKNLKVGNRLISSFYTPYGISGIDGWFAKHIRNGPDRYTKEDMTRMIRRNPHLSNIIKTNLLDNLESIWK
jgi:hypothetical protein